MNIYQTSYFAQEYFQMLRGRRDILQNRHTDAAKTNGNAENLPKYSTILQNHPHVLDKRTEAAYRIFITNLKHISTEIPKE